LGASAQPQRAPPWAPSPGGGPLPASGQGQPMLSNSERRRPAARTTRHHSEVHSPYTLWVSCVCLVLARKNCTRPTDAIFSTKRQPARARRARAPARARAEGDRDTGIRRLHLVEAVSAGQISIGVFLLRGTFHRNLLGAVRYLLSMWRAAVSWDSLPPQQRMSGLGCCGSAAP